VVKVARDVARRAARGAAGGVGEDVPDGGAAAVDGDGALYLLGKGRKGGRGVIRKDDD
jgi:hypothetical protein